ncbi:MAG: 50S ribosomal protein L23 [Clostridiales bacterium]|nr:50S ribosomal protein L23 [Clostridiales bacterium]
MQNIHDVLIRPLVTEKSMLLMEENKYCFLVNKKANKIEIRKAVEGLFNVSVLKVTTRIVKGKIKRMGRTQGKRPDTKKAIITLAAGNKIEIFNSLQ